MFFFNLEIAQQRKVAIVRLIVIFVDYFELLFVHFLRYVKNNIFTVRWHQKVRDAFGPGRFIRRVGIGTGMRVIFIIGGRFFSSTPQLFVDICAFFLKNPGIFRCPVPHHPNMPGF